MPVTPPTPRDEVYRLYWYFAAERQAMFNRRIAGEPPPWTSDAILQTFKFCNVYRASDRISQYLIRNVAYLDGDESPEDRIFQIVAFRTFSKIETWETAREILGQSPKLSHLESGEFGKALEEVRARNGGLYTGAFILCATDAYGQGLKHRNHVELFRDMFIKTHAAQQILAAKSLSEVFHILHSYPLMGDFMSYQTATDLNYSDLLDFSEDDFTMPGPGSQRGLRKVFTDLGDLSAADAIHWMVDRQEEEFARFGLTFNGLWGRRLHAIDCQGLFCEVDKYCREALPDLTSARKRIKARFTPHRDSLSLFFPPKWGINRLLPQVAVLGRTHARALF